MAPGEYAESAGEYDSPGDQWFSETATAWVGALAGREGALWSLVLVALLADVVTTLAGLRLGLAEGNPLIAGVLEGSGVGGFVAVKALALAVAVGVRLATPRFRVAVSMGIALPWLFAATINVALILHAT